MGKVIQPADVRSRLREALELDLIGPGVGHPLAVERLPGWVRPSNWYLTGFLVPRGAPAEQRADADADDDFEPEVAVEAGLGDDSTEDRRSAKKGFFPSSMGLSFLVAEGVGRLDVTVRWGDYRYVEDATRDDGRTDDAPDGGESSDGTEGAADGAVVKSEGKASTRWQRRAREETVPVTLAVADNPYQEPVPGSHGLILHVVARPVSATTFAGRIPPGTRSVSLFLVNGRPPEADAARDEAFAFQAELEVRGAVPFVPRPDPRGVSGDDSDERVADLHYADTPEYAAGHGVAADWELVDGACRLLRTTWIPTAEVETTQTEEVPGVELAMAALGDLSDGGAAEQALTPLVAGYRAWIDQQDAALTDLTGDRRETAEELVFDARSAANRMERGIRFLSQDADALDAFRVANRAVAAALSRRLAREGVTEPPRWRAFQLSGRRRPGWSRGQRDHALHAATAHPRPARTCSRPGVCAGAGAAQGRPPVWRVAVRDRPLGRQGGHSQPPRRTRRQPLGLGTEQGQPVQEQPARQARPHSPGELPLVRGGLHPGFVHAAAELGSPDGIAHRLCQLGVRLLGRHAVAHRGRGQPLYRRLPAFVVATVDKFARLRDASRAAREALFTLLAVRRADFRPR